MKILLLTLVLAGLLSSQACAHAFLQKANPGAGAEVSGSPPALILTYTEPVEPLFTTVAVTNAAGTSFVAGKTTSRDGGRTVVVPLATLPPGDYAVAWHAVSVDTHKTDGHFSFTVK